MHLLTNSYQVGLYLFPSVVMENSEGSEQMGREQSHGQRRQQSRLQREEAFYHFVNNLSEEDYRLMRDNSLFGTPGEISEEELLSRLQQVKERSSESRNAESAGQEQADGSNGDSSSAVHHHGSQSWRAVSRTNLSSGDFRFSLEINVSRNMSSQQEPTEDGERLEEGVEEPARPQTVAERESRVAVREMLAETSEEEVAVVVVPEPEPLRPNTPPVISPIRLEVQNLVPSDSPSRGPRRRASRMARSHSPEQGRTRPRPERSRSPFRWDPLPQAQEEGSSRTRQSVTEREALPDRVAPEQQEAEDSGAGAWRPPTIRLNLRVRQARPGEPQDSVGSRTGPQPQAPSETVQYESERSGFHRTFSRSEQAGIRTYVSTIRIPVQRLADSGLSEATSSALRIVIRQIMTGFGELSSLTDSDSHDSSNSSQEPGRSAAEEVPRRPAAVGAIPFARGPYPGVPLPEERGGGAAEDSGEGRAEPGTLPFLRLAHFFLLNDEDEDQPHGLTKEQIDNLSTRSFRFGESGSLQTCSVCITDYAEGHKLRQLPCSHEYHVHCIDRWLSENSTCPICRHAVLASANRESAV
ncbi:E3 ubiquitin-protein ligase RLIM-like isoform X2 [Anguilla rostrata]|uniref:E3 ubiquitin-protein ligase RLIM-like isoform X2 n=1 Tax=Anguilla rostrata TaxID=7938 RepID=UPI0030D2E956